MAFALSIGLFVYFWVIGYAVVAALHTQRDLVRNALIAPAVGVVCTIYPVYLLSRLGFPVRSFAHILTAITIAVAVILLVWRRPLVPRRHLVPYLPILVFAFAAVGWPLLSAGFAWLGSINPDMSNYVLLAHRLAEQAYIQAPDPTVWRQQSDWVAYSVVYTAIGSRSGAELLLAWLIVLTGWNGAIVYMPLLIALHVALITAATALISTPHRYARLLAAVLLSSSATLTLGIVFQLLAQVLGLLLLALGSVLCLAPIYRLSWRAFSKFVPLAAITMATLMLTYPEVLPFFGIAFLLYHGFAANEFRRFLRPALVTIPAIAILGSLLITPDAIGYFTFLVGQARSSQANMALPELFPYFLVPQGLAALWGFPIVGAQLHVAVIVVGIIVGAGLGIAAIASTVWLIRRREPEAALAAVMIALAPFLFFANSGFGLLKLAMFAQPFLLSTLVVALCRLFRVTR